MHIGRSQNLALSHSLQAVQCAVHVYILSRACWAEDTRVSAPHAIYRGLSSLTELRPPSSGESTSILGIECPHDVHLPESLIVYLILADTEL